MSHGSRITSEESKKLVNNKLVGVDEELLQKTCAIDSASAGIDAWNKGR